MNPNTEVKRGCFIRKEDNGKATVVDYPTWTFNKYGTVLQHQNEPIPAGQEFEKTFDTVEAAREFAIADNYIVCAAPNSKPADIDIADEYEDDEDAESESDTF